ncbi:MAG: Rrf2 family transcriptional regulator [Candidatus Krumholzibacteriota bacterium]|nr:Rrf2 family transcriptional regulator [Candidatus Krumholzibacteriota bacterium]
MNSLIDISGGAFLALHSLALMAAREPEKINLKTISDRLDVSEAHLAKVMQRLSKAGFVSSYRGPAGGFTLNKPTDEISLLDIYECIEGKVELGDCPLGRGKCIFKRCIFSDSLSRISKEIYNTLRRLKLANFSDKLE